MTQSTAPLVEARSTIETGTRLGWIDSARGLGIILVVVGHVWRGMDSSSLITNGVLFSTVDRIIYSFHMRLFFFLSGLVFKVQDNVDIRATLSPRLTRLLWPFVLWTWIYFAFKLVAGSRANTPMTVSEFPFSPLPPREQFWFLWALLIVQISVAFYLPWAQRLWGWVAAMAIAALASLIIYLHVPLLEGGAAAPYLWGAMLHLPYFLAGIAYARLSPQIRFGGGIFPHFAIFIAVVAIGVFLTGSLIDLTVGLVASIALTTTLRHLADREMLAMPLDLLVKLGMASMAIYLAHVIFTASTRIALKVVGINDLAPQLILGTIAGIVFPFLLYRLAKRAGVSRTLGF